jgi:hypothetical protein
MTRQPPSKAIMRQIFFRSLLRGDILGQNTPGLPRNSVRSETTILQGQERHVAE